MATDGMDEDFVWKVPGMHRWRGVVCPTDMTKEICKWIEDELTFTMGDVILQCYGDSKVRWIQEVLHLLHHPEELDFPKRAELGYCVPFLDKHHRGIDPKELVKGMKPMLSKSHLHGDVLGHHVEAGEVKVIFWFMDPRQILVNYHTLLSTMACKMLGWKPVDWSVFHESYKRRQMFEGDWFDFIRSWQPHLRRKNVLTLYYEDVATDVKGSVERIAQFCGLDLSDEVKERVSKCVPFDAIGPNPESVFTKKQMEEFNERFNKEMAASESQKRYSR